MPKGPEIKKNLLPLLSSVALCSASEGWAKEDFFLNFYGSLGSNLQFNKKKALGLLSLFKSILMLK